MSEHSQPVSVTSNELSEHDRLRALVESVESRNDDTILRIGLDFARRLLAEHAPETETGGWSVRVPQSENEAAAMTILGMEWLRLHAPQRLKAGALVEPPTEGDEVWLYNRRMQQYFRIDGSEAPALKAPAVDPDWPPRLKVDQGIGGLTLVLSAVRDGKLTIEQALQCFSEASMCGKPMPNGKGAGQCINVPGHEGDCDDMPF